MNVATMSNNNVADSVVLPPAMNNIRIWYEEEYSEKSGTEDGHPLITYLYDRSGYNNPVVQGTVINQPRSILSVGHSHRRGIFFDEYSFHGSGNPTYLAEGASFDLEDIFGTTVVEVSNPDWTMAVVLHHLEGGGAGGLPTFIPFTLTSSANSAELQIRGNAAGMQFTAKIANGTTAASDTSHPKTVGTVETIVVRCQSDGVALPNAGTEVSIWVAGTMREWDGASSPEEFLPMGANNVYGGIDGLTLSGGYWDGALYEFIFWKGALQTKLVVEAIEYLQDKWGCD